MKRCAYCGRENVDEAVACQECGTELGGNEAGYEFPQLTDADMRPSMVTLVTCANLGAADIVVARLQAAGIQAFIPDERALQGYGLAGTFGFARVQVSQGDYKAARELLEGD